jgi:hypothetical protein
MAPLLMAASSAPAFRQRPLTLTAFGTPRQVGALVGELGTLLASRLSMTPQPIDADATPQLALQSIGATAEPGPDGVLLIVPIDPGVPLPGGGSWAEALGAWRLPTLVLLGAEQLRTGWPAAATALLRHHRVPLVGLIQGGGPWVEELRRQDGLPWLGHLDADSEDREPLRSVVLDRCRRMVASLL